MLECTKFRSHVQGNLQGFADFYISAWDLEINGCTLFMKNGRRWLNFPAREYKNEAGEQKYAPIVRFRDKKTFDRFCEKAKDAIDAWCRENNGTQEPEPPTQEELPF